MAPPTTEPREPPDELRAGRAVLGLVEQIRRLRQNRCPTMGFGFDHTAVEDAVESELAEVRAESPCSARAQEETRGLLATALHAVIVHGGDPVGAFELEADKLSRRLDVVENGGTWVEAKAMERRRG